MFGSWYGLPTGQWCAMFISWCADQAGAQDIIPKHAYAPSGAGWFKAKGQWRGGISGIARGDVVYYDFPGLPNRISHVGIVESVNGDGSVNTIEGNTSGMAGGSQRNGGLCARKRRKAYIVGFGRPAYSNAPNPAPQPVDNRRRNADQSLTIDVDGERGPGTIGRWQEVMGTSTDGVISHPSSGLIVVDQTFLNRVVAREHIKNLTGRPLLVADGDEGRKTILVRQFWLRNAMNPVHQNNLIGHVLAFDGAWGPESTKVLQFALNNAWRASSTYGIV